MKADLSCEVQLPTVPDVPLQGRRRKGKLLQIYGPFSGCGSLSNVITQVARALLETCEDTALHCYNGDRFFDASLADHASLCPGAPVAVYWGVPGIIPREVFRHDFRIGGFVCETDVIPQSWVAQCNRFDLIVVPSHFCRDVFSECGVTAPIMVVPHGLDPEYVPMRSGYRDGRFVFYNPVSAGFARRKGTPELVRAFKRAFPGREDVVLRLRSSEAQIIHEEAAPFGGVSSHPCIEIEAAHTASTPDFAAIYSDVDCTVHPTRGEGFGLIPLQSIACETPVIAPASTGIAEYVTAGNALLLRDLPPQSPAKNDEWQNLRVIDENHLVDRMQYVRCNWKAEYDRLRRLAPEHRRRYAWKEVLAPFLETMHSMVGANPNDRKRLAREAATERRRKKAFLVLAPESSGGHLVTEILLNAGCAGSLGASRNWSQDRQTPGPDSEKPWEPALPIDTQPWDKELPRHEPLVVWRRSVPHGGRFPDIVHMAGKLRERHYDVVAVIVERDDKATAGSQVKWRHVPDTDTAMRNIAEARGHIVTGVAEADIRHVHVAYETLVAAPRAQETLLRDLGLEVPAAPVPVWDGNAKWQSQAVPDGAITI